MENNNGDNSEVKSVYPIIIDACPNCGSKSRLGAGAIQLLKDDKKLHKDSFNEGLVHQIALVDPLHPPTILAGNFTVKMMLVYWDVCECGTMYCTKFNIVDAPAQAQFKPAQPGSRFPGFPPGPMGRG